MKKLIALTEMLRKTEFPASVAHTIDEKLAAATKLIEEAQAELALTKINSADLAEAARSMGEGKDIEIAQLQSDLKIAQDDLQIEKAK